MPVHDAWRLALALAGLPACAGPQVHSRFHASCSYEQAYRRGQADACAGLGRDDYRPALCAPEQIEEASLGYARGYASGERVRAPEPTAPTFRAPPASWPEAPEDGDNGDDPGVDLELE